MMYKSKNNPPRIAAWLLRKFLPESDVHLLMGDFEEDFKDICCARGRINANLWYWRQVVISVPSFINYFIQRSAGMLKNYIKIAIRNMLKSKMYTAINVFGLSIGISCCAIVFTFVKNEYTYDMFHKDAEKIFLVGSNIEVNGLKSFHTGSSLKTGPELQSEFSFIKNSTTVMQYPWFVQADKEKVRLKTVIVNEQFFEIFSFPLANGSSHLGLFNQENTVIISDKLAEHQFKEKNPLGQRLSLKLINAIFEFEVVGIVKIPENSSLKFDILLPFKSLSNLEINWALNQSSSGTLTFVKVSDGYDHNPLTMDHTEQLPGGVEIGMSQTFHLVSLTALHYKDDIKGMETEPPANHTYTFILGLITVVIVFIACANFINMSMGLLVKRTREVGIRRVFGAKKKQLRRQLWSENIILCFFALLAGLILAEITMPAFNSYIGQNISINYFSDYSSILFFGTLLVVLSASATVYPSIVLSKLPVAVTLQNKEKIRFGNRFRKLLITIQFAATITLIACSLFMKNQISYLYNKDLGFNSEGILVVAGKDVPEFSMAELIKENLMLHKDILGVVRSNYGIFDVFLPYRPYGHLLYDVANIRIDYDFLPTLGIKIVRGRNFDRSIKSDVSSIIVNESFLSQLGINYPEESELDNGYSKTKIIGVVRDFHHQSFNNTIRPIMLNMVWDSGSIGRLYVKVNPENWEHAKAHIFSTLNELAPNFEPEIKLLETIKKEYFIEQDKLAKVIMAVTIVAITIAMLGLFSFTSFSISLRTKEIGIRKTLGASFSDIIRLLNRELSLTLCSSCLIACPVAYIVMQKWFQNFIYRIPTDLKTFILAIGSILILAFLTISIKAIRIASSNPTDSLRYE